MTPRPDDRCAAVAGSGFSMLEAVISLFVVGTLLTASMSAARSSLQGQAATYDRARGLLLAQGLMAEILEQAYGEPFEIPVFGPEPSEAIGTRAGFDDIDDYHDWNAATPQAAPHAKDGTALPGLAGWVGQVTVTYVDPDDLTQAVGSNQGVKRITVSVRLNDRPMATLVMVRTDAWANVPME